MAMMISKFHKLIQSKVVWIAFATLISIAFVWSYSGSKSSSPRSRSEQQDVVVGKLFGEEVTRAEFGQAKLNAYLMAMLRTGQFINISEQIDQLLDQNAWQRLAILKKARQMGMVVTDEQIANAIRQQPMFINQQTGMFDRNAYDAFFSQTLPRMRLRMSPKQFEIMLGENLLIDKASGMATQGALATEAEVDHAYHIYTDEITVQYASIPRSMADVPEVTEDDAKEYYYNYPNQFTYPDKVKVRYVEFPAEDFKAKVEVTEEMITQVYENNKAMFIVEGTEENAQPEYQPLEEVRDTIIEEITNGLALRKAITAAGMFVSELSNPDVSFDQAAESTGKEITTTPPFALTDTIRDIDPTAAFARTAFSLQNDDTHYYSDPVAGNDAVYVLALHSKMPSFLPDYDVVAADAMAAAKMVAEENAYAEKAEAIHAGIETALKEGQPFDAAAGNASLEIATLGPFSVENPPTEDLEQSIMKATALFGAGTLVDLIPGEDEFMVAYIASKEASDRTAADPMMIAQIKASIRNDKASRLASAWQQSVMEEANLEEISEDNGDNS